MVPPTVEAPRAYAEPAAPSVPVARTICSVIPEVPVVLPIAKALALVVPMLIAVTGTGSVGVHGNRAGVRLLPPDRGVAGLIVIAPVAAEVKPWCR